MTEEKETFYSIDEIPGDFTGICNIFSESEDNGLYYWFEGQIHNPNGPAILYKDGAVSYKINGLFHRLDGPAFICPKTSSWYDSGKTEYYINEILYYYNFISKK